MNDACCNIELTAEHMEGDSQILLIPVPLLKDDVPRTL
jgi:hypothetical protein